MTKFEKSTEVGACACPKGTYDNMEKSCVDVFEGVDRTTSGMTLETLKIEPGYWRTNLRSPDIRECLVAMACAGGNTTNYCREGHKGPYCEICTDSYAKDAFLLCQSCDTTATSVALSILLTVTVGAIIVGGFIYLTKKKEFYKRVKNGGKIIFAALQITSSLPAAVPAMPLPKTFKDAVSAAQILNVDIFQLVSVGCFSASINFYHHLLMNTVPVLTICAVFVLAGRRNPSKKAKYFTWANAILYLTLPRIATTVFEVFSCDDLDDGSSLLRTDYTIDCNDDSRTFWVFYGIIMVLVFPFGVTANYFKLLHSKRKRIMQDLETREKDEELKDIVFLFEPYKPEFWYFEVVETVRRLLMTGVLSIIKPGTYSQLSYGLFLSIFFTVLLAALQPYNEVRDNR